jgi:plasmid stabilization system protein ParE
VTIRWTDIASSELAQLTAYVYRLDRNAALRLKAKVLDRVRQLRHFPELGRIGKLNGTRELFVRGTSYIVVYEVDGKNIVINRLIHAAQLYPPDAP